MLPSIDQLLATVRQLEPSASQSDIVNGLTLAYCRAEAQNGGLAKPELRWRLARFSQLVYTQIASRGKD